MQEPSPEGKAAAEKAQELIMQTLSGLKRRQQRNPVGVTIGLAQSVPLQSAYADALNRGDEKLAEGLVITTVGFLNGAVWEPEGTIVKMEALAVLLSHRKKEKRSGETPWCTDIVNTMHHMGMIGDPDKA